MLDHSSDVIEHKYKLTSAILHLENKTEQNEDDNSMLESTRPR